MNKEYTFIHPTKSGGTALENYFEEHYKNYINGRGHSNKCTNNNNPIMVVRDVKSRFYSMYKYWKNGAIDGKYIRNQNWKITHKDISIFDFIHLLKNDNKKKLSHTFTWSEHFKNTSTWIDKKTHYKNIIIIKYDDDLNDKIQKLIDILGIKQKNIIVPHKNVSNNINCECDLDDIYVNKFINEYFADDIELINKIDNNPEIFKLVI